MSGMEVSGYSSTIPESEAFPTLHIFDDLLTDENFERGPQIHLERTQESRRIRTRLSQLGTEQATENFYFLLVLLVRRLLGSNPGVRADLAREIRRERTLGVERCAGSRTRPGFVRETSGAI